MTEHEKRIREFLSERGTMRGLCPEQIAGANDSRLNTTDLRALLADLDAMRAGAMRADARRYAAFFTSGLPVCFEGQDHYSKADCDAAIDAALKGASHE